MYKVFDLETENHKVNKRFASPFSDKNWIVARGWKNQGDTKCSWTYHPKPDGSRLMIEDHITLLVGHNIKFDLLYEWENPSLKAFFKRGGRIWDTQYAEYLLSGMHPDTHMNSMDDLAEKYGGRKKINAVKAMWEAGYLTSQIDKDMLIDYLVGTEDEGRDSGDIGNTEKIFLGQIKQAHAEKMIPMIQARMDGLCATTEMEFNGLKIDVPEAARRMKIMEKELNEADKELEAYIPELPDGLEFNWGSNHHKSALIFGGGVKYEKSAPYLDEKTGDWARYKAFEQWPLVNGEAVSPNEMEGKIQDTFTSGKNKGAPKFKKVEVQGEIKTKIQTFVFDLPGHTVPNPEWVGAHVDGHGQPIYATNDDVITELGTRDIPFLKAMAKRQSLAKDLGTYYVRYDMKKKDYTGMLTCVIPGIHIVHHELNHTSTVTSRLSSSNPNLQNIPRADTSEVKKMFISRFVGGMMMEADYSQLEVVVQGFLSGDKNLCQDLRDRIDFHCKRVANKFGCTYEEALYRCKSEDFVDHKEWKNKRTGVKEFSFQRAYGAGAAAIAASTGMSIDDVKDLIEAEDIMYPGVTEYNAKVEIEVKKNAKAFKDPIRGFRTFRRGYYTAPTGTKYTFRSYDPQKWQKEKGINDSFLPTELKNYPIQGTGGEIVQIILGKLWRHFVANDNYNGNALLCNTVHDCVWFDYHPVVQDQLAIDVKTIMESVPEVLNELYGLDVPVPFPVEVEVGANMYDKKVLHV